MPRTSDSQGLDFPPKENLKAGRPRENETFELFAPISILKHSILYSTTHLALGYRCGDECDTFLWGSSRLLDECGLPAIVLNAFLSFSTLGDLTMTGCIRIPHVTACAFATATIVTLSLWTAPPERHGSVTPRSEFAAVQLSAAVSTQAAAVVDTNPPNAASLPSIAASVALESKQAAAVTPENLLQTLAIGALAIVGAPLWWVAFPVTIPLSIVGAGFFINVAAAFGRLDCGFCAAPSVGEQLATGLAFGIPFGLLFYVAAPISLAISAVSSLLAPTTSPTAAAVPIRAAAVTLGATATTVGAATESGADDSTAPSRRSPGRRARALAQPSESAHVLAATKAAAATARPAAARQSAHRSGRSAQDQP